MQLVMNEWKATNANYEHNCAVRTKKPRARAMLREATSIVEDSRTVTILALGTPLKATMGFGDISGRTLSRLRQEIRNGGSEEKLRSTERWHLTLRNSRQQAEGP